MPKFVIDDSTPNHILFPLQFGRGYDAEARARAGYAGVADPFPDHLLIPRSEWQARIEEKVASKTQISDLCDQANLPCLNQEQTNYCACDKTEVLTDRGWTRWADYDGADLLGTVDVVSGHLEFQAPTHFHAIEHDGPMVYSTHQALDFAVTPDHRMLVRKWDESRRRLSDHYTFQRAADLGWYCGLMHAPTGFLGAELRRIAIPGDREYDGDDFLAMLALIISDGYAGGSESTRNWVSFACHSDHMKTEIKALAARVGFREKPSDPDVMVRYDAGALAAWLRSNAYASDSCTASTKKVPDVVKWASVRQITHFLEYFRDRVRKPAPGRSNEYFSVSRRVIDDLQELLLRVGRRGSIWLSENAGKEAVLDNGIRIRSRHDLHCLYERRTDRLSLDRKANIEVEPYKGMVYCATVPNGTLVTRRNGSVLISGNCWVNGPTYCTEVIRTIQGQAPVPLSPASVGGPITGFQNVGGWAKPALQYISEHGIVPQDQWPANAIDDRYHTDSNVQLALAYRVTEWWDLNGGDVVANLVSCLLRGYPVAVGYNWWSHVVSAIDPVWQDGSIAIRIRNSWGMTWQDRGYAILQGQRMVPDDAVSPRVVAATS